MRELQKMLLADRLIGSEKDVVVLPARNAWPFYEEFHAYACQVGRTFQPVKRLAFYTRNLIREVVPLIIQKVDLVEYEAGRYSGRLGDFVAKALERGAKRQGESNQVFLLSAPDDDDTVHLTKPVSNNLGHAFTQNQRYVSLAALKVAEYTSELAESQ